MLKECLDNNRQDMDKQYKALQTCKVEVDSEEAQGKVHDNNLL